MKRVVKPSSQYLHVVHEDVAGADEGVLKSAEKVAGHSDFIIVGENVERLLGPVLAPVANL